MAAAALAVFASESLGFGRSAPSSALVALINVAIVFAALSLGALAPARDQLQRRRRVLTPLWLILTAVCVYHQGFADTDFSFGAVLRALLALCVIGAAFALILAALARHWGNILAPGPRDPADDVQERRIVLCLFGVAWIALKLSAEAGVEILPVRVLRGGADLLAGLLGAWISSLLPGRGAIAALGLLAILALLELL